MMEDLYDFFNELGHEEDSRIHQAIENSWGPSCSITSTNTIDQAFSVFCDLSDKSNIEY